MSAAGRAGAQELASVFESDARVLVRVDRLEPTKNIVRGLQAYELLLRTHPELHGTVRHLVLLVPSRQGLARYRKYDREVRRLVQRINSEFGTKEWEPITAFFENDRPRALVAAREADVVLVNPVIDGMNLVVKEAIVVSAHDAVIVLSRTAGAYRELRDAVLAVTATDIEETAEQLYEALNMPEQERHQRAQQARQIVEQTTPTQWALNQLRDVAYIRASPKEKMQAQSLQRVG
jgi:trehalose 6-phosphate synthase